MAKTEKDPLQKLSTLTAKALQRGEKLERTLTKLIAHSDPGSAAEDLLKALQSGLKTIQKNVKSVKKTDSTALKKATKGKAGKSTKKPGNRKPPLRNPVAAETSPLAEVTGRE